MNLTGTIPPELEILESLQSLSLPYNNLRGQLPSGISNLKSLLRLDVDQNMLSGNPMDTLIPQGSSDTFSELAVLKMAYNAFDSWSIPENIDQLMPNLQSVLLQGSSITGTIPTALGELSLLRK